MASPAHKAYRGTVVVLDDEVNMGRILSKVLALEGYHATVFTEPREALAHLDSTPADILLTDVRMPAMSGEDVLRQVRESGLGCEVIMMTAFGTIEGAIACVKQGAFDYITKPFKTDELLMTLARSLEHKRLKEMNTALSRKFSPDTPTGAEKPLLGDSPAMQRVRELIDRVAPSDSPVLLTGESGTGKELAARAIHRGSRRARGRFVAINCASIPENLIESELFGHERGAFTGATETKVGLVELADGGTLFLDEIGELPQPLQAKLLRVLQEREITRVGGLADIPVNIRVVSATNRDLAKAITERTFREDLFYRLNVISIELPPLRERREDIPLLAEHFLARKASKLGRPAMRLSEAVLEALRLGQWRGNVRELENTIERLVVLSDTDVITSDLLPESLGAPPRKSSSADGVTKLALTAHAMVEEAPDFRSAREQFEREYLEALLRNHGGSVTEAARAAGMSRRNLYDKVEKLRISLELIKDEAGSPRL